MKKYLTPAVLFLVVGIGAYLLIMRSDTQLTPKVDL
jgi:hypothetical protein